MTVEVKNRFTGEVICSGDSLREAVRNNAQRLSGANLSGARLRGANLSCARLRGADLSDARLAWQSHDLLAEILRHAADGDHDKLKIAGFVLICRDKCWSDFARLASSDSIGDWALDTLAGWVRPGDGAPDIICSRVKSQVTEVRS